MDYSAGGSAATLATSGATQRVEPAVVGPALFESMGEPALVAALNAWGGAMHREVLALRADLSATQVGVSGAFEQAHDAVRELVAAFRLEVAATRQQTFYEARQSLANLEQVVEEARAKFGEQDTRFSAGLGELAQRLQAADAWAQAEPTRIAAAVQAAPAPPWLSAPVPGFLTPPTAGVGRMGSPGHAAPTSGAWAAYAAGRAAEGPAPPDAWARRPQQQTQPTQQTQQQPQQQQPTQYNIASPPGFGNLGGAGGGFGGKGGHPQELRIIARDWGDSRKLDITVKGDSFQVWKDRAMMFLSKARPDVRALLTWAEAQTKEDLETNLDAQSAHIGVADLAAIEYAIHDGIKAIVVDGLLGRARNCVGRGCELWRSLVAEWSGGAPQVLDAKARRALEPPRCKDINELWARLPAWERLSDEVISSGLVLPPWMRNSALEKIIPAQLLSTMVAHSEVQGYEVRLAWVKTQMEHARGVAQAAEYGPSGTGKDASGDVYMNSVEAHADDGGLAWALSNAVDQGDWAQAEMLQGAILAVKGGGKGGFRKGLGKGKAGGKGGAAYPAAAGPKPEFQGYCNHCNHWGHRLSDCRKRDAEGKKGGAKGDKGAGKGGKGGPKGGKGPPAAPVATVAGDEGDWAAALADAGAGDPDAEYDEWNLGGTIASLTPWVQAPARRGRRGGRTWRAFDAAPTPVQNTFSGLNSLLDDAEVLLGAVAGETRGGGRVVEAVVDSGAVHCVAPPRMFPGKVVPSPWSRTGRGYRAANGTGIKNLGQVDVPFATAEGQKCKIQFQVAEVEQALLSVSCLTSAGNLVQLGDSDGNVVNLKTGRTIALERRGGVYIMKMFIPDAAAPLPFGRQGA